MWQRRGCSFSLLAKDGLARRGALSLPRGIIQTPAFMPVGTAATVKGVWSDDVAAAGADILLGNTYHLMLRPTAERVHRLGGLHTFMNWQKPILTDSGGFQVMSLASLREIDETGVTFRSHLDGSKHMMTPERSIEIQTLLGADIVMQLDECVKLPATHEQLSAAMSLSLRWARRCQEAFGQPHGRLMFGIVQGGDIPDLRRRSLEGLCALDCDGYAIGGLAVGEPQSVMFSTLDATTSYLPDNQPRYLMGVGSPSDVLGAVKRGVDMFDCVMPTREGRHGVAFTFEGRLNLKNARFADDETPLDPLAEHPVPKTYTKAYLHHLIKSDEMLGVMILSLTNTAFYQQMMKGAREAIEKGTFDAYCTRFEKLYPPRGQETAVHSA